jgi:hypothetical protein
MAKKSMSLSFALAGLVCLTSNAANVAAQAQNPSDSQVKKVIASSKTVDVTLGKPGSTEWSQTYNKYIWTRHFVAKLKTADPSIFLLEKGYAVYDVVGPNYVFWRTVIISNGFEGIPDPSASEVRALIDKLGVDMFLGNYYYNQVMGEVESIGLAQDPKFDWHTPNSVSFDVAAVYVEKTNDVGGKEKVRRTFRIRLFRSNQKSDWKSVMSVPEDRTKL